MTEPSERLQEDMGSVQKLSFEEAYEALAESVGLMEGGRLDLEEALRLYEQGMLLANRCNALLEAAELRVTQLAMNSGQRQDVDSENNEEQDEAGVPN